MRRYRFSNGGHPWTARAVFSALWLSACASGQVLEMQANDQAVEPSSQPSSSQASAVSPGLPLRAAQDPNGPRYEPAAGSPALAAAPTPGDAGRAVAALADRVYGVTLDDVSPLYDISEALAGLAKKPTTRVIFDPLRAPTSYQSSLRRLQDVSYVMGSLLDSVAVPDFTPEQYATRASDYVEQIGELVDIWEIGTEVNGEWLGASEDVAAKIDAAFDQVTSHGKRTALTLYYNVGCVQHPENELFTWAKTNVSDAMKRGLDYVFVTYYEERCHQPEPDWRAVFKQLREIFPTAKLGIGGCGTSDEARKPELVQHYYSLQVDVPGYVGGYFWWYFRQDMQPVSKPLWSVLNDSLETVPL